MSVRNQLVEMIDFVPETELPVLLEVVRRFVPSSPDDFATADDLDAHRAAVREYAAGETVPHEAINWD